MSKRRITAFCCAIALAAAPLVWLDLDPNAGEKLLKLTNNRPSVQTASLR